MSTMKKRIPVFLLALAMMVAMALPSFAATFRSNIARSIPTNYPYFRGCWNDGRDSNGDMYELKIANLKKTYLLPGRRIAVRKALPQKKQALAGV